MKSRVYLAEWKLAAGEKFKKFLIKLFLSALVVSAVSVLYFSRGLDAYLSNAWKVSIFLKDDVSEEVGALFADKLERLSFVESAVYHGEDEVWEEFLSAVEGKDDLKELIGRPIPGYIEVKFSKGSLNEVNLKRLLGICEDEGIARDVIYGEGSFRRVMKLKRYLNASIYVSAAFFLMVVTLFFYFLDASVLASIAGELRFALLHDSRFLNYFPWMFLGRLLEGVLAGFVSYGVFAFALFKFSSLHPSISVALGTPRSFSPVEHLFPFLVSQLAIVLIFLSSSYFSLRRVREAVEVS